MNTRTTHSERTASLTAAHTDFSIGLNSHAYFKVQNRELSTDLVQDTFAKTWSYLSRGGSILAMKSFLYHTLNNLIVDHYRKKKHMSLDILLDGGFEPAHNPWPRTLQCIDGKAAQRMIMRLPVPYQKVMRLRHIRDMTISEISAETRETKNAIAVKLHRGLAKLIVLYTAQQLNNRN